MRKKLGDEFPYRLDGELDKVNHPEIHERIGPKKPDFVVHVPGDMNRNLVVIEVKTISAAMNENTKRHKNSPIISQQSGIIRKITLLMERYRS